MGGWLTDVGVRRDGWGISLAVGLTSAPGVGMGSGTLPNPRPVLGGTLDPDPNGHSLGSFNNGKTCDFSGLGTCCATFGGPEMTGLPGETPTMPHLGSLFSGL